MEKESIRFWDLATSTLSFAYHDGSVTPIESGHHIDWRRLPALAASYIEGYDVTLELENGGPVRIGHGEVICVRPWLRHRLSTSNVRRGVSRWSHTAFTIFGGVDVFSFFDTPFVIRGEPARRIGAINEELSAIAKGRAYSWPQSLRREALGLELLTLVVECSRTRPERQLAADSLHRLGPALEYMSSHMAETIYHERLATLCGLSLSRFYAVFKEGMGTAPGQYLQDLRLKRARSLLLSGDTAVKTVAAEVGYPDEFHFSRLFRKRFGRSPSEHRRLARDYRM